MNQGCEIRKSEDKHVFGASRGGANPFIRRVRLGDIARGRIHDGHQPSARTLCGITEEMDAAGLRWPTLRREEETGEREEGGVSFHGHTGALLAMLKVA